MTKGRIVIIPFLHGRLTDDGKLIEPNIEAILEKWLERHPQFRGSERGYRTIRAKTSLPEGIATDLVRVTAEFSPALADYDPAEDADLYEEFLAEDDGSSSTEPHKIWIEQFEAAENIEDDFGTQKALEYLVGEKFLNFLEAAETDADFRAEIPAFVAKIKTIFERWQLAQYLETAKETEPFDPKLFEPRSHPLLGDEEIEFDEEEIEDMRKDDIRQCTRDLLLVERAREWLVED
jgi:hypothetical protein